MPTKKKLPIKKSAPKVSAHKAKQPPAKKSPLSSAKPVAKTTIAKASLPKIAGKPIAKTVTIPVKKELPSVKGNKPNANATELKRMILERKIAPKAIAFSLDEVREIAKKNEHQIESTSKASKSVKSTSEVAKQLTTAGQLNHPTKPHKPHHVKAASLADILGFNPKKGKPRAAMIDEKDVPEKYRRYYRLLLALRMHVLVQLGEHTEETLLKSSKDDSGDLSGYGQHMADAGTDTFDRDFALSLVSNEQEALAEIEAAIKRVHAGTYGICETTLKPIAKDRLLAVPFTRYSAEAKKQVERHSHRSVERGGLFGDGTEEEGGKMPRGDDDGE